MVKKNNFNVGDEIMMEGQYTNCFFAGKNEDGELLVELPKKSSYGVNWNPPKNYKSIGNGKFWIIEKKDNWKLVKPKLKPLGDTIRGDGEFITKDSGQRVEFKDGMVRDISTDKTRYDLIPIPMLKRWADLLQRGAKKYGERNWEKANTPEALNRFKESAIRHLYQWLEGDTREDHASAILFNVAGAEMVQKKLNDSKR